MSNPDRRQIDKMKRRRVKETKPLPEWKVILHNDEINKAVDVAKAVVALTPLDIHKAIEVTELAHKDGTALMLTTHLERAELYREQFATCFPKPITVTIEPEDQP
jgi:ATP-dependent Clp protease adapter protein ClpS